MVIDSKSCILCNVFHFVLPHYSIGFWLDGQGSEALRRHPSLLQSKEYDINALYWRLYLGGQFGHIE